MAMAEAEGEIVVKIGDPEKHGEGVSGYVSYEIQTKTSMPGFEKPSFFVRRRYNDFVWLRQALEEKHPDCIVPPLPEKEQLHYLERFAEQFIDHRRQALEVFLWRLADHPVLSQSKDFHTFLEAKVWVSASSTDLKSCSGLGNSEDGGAGKVWCHAEVDHERRRGLLPTQGEDNEKSRSRL